MKLIITFFAACISLKSVSQYTLPKVMTTEIKAFDDLTMGKANENWFIKKVKNFTVYEMVFRNTPVGLKHAFEKYYSLRTEYETDDCNDRSLISNIALKEDKSFDYEMLSISIKNEMSEIKIRCTINDSKIESLNLNSARGQNGFITLMLLVK